MARYYVETPCEHGKMGKHLLAERRFDPCERKDGSTRCGARHVPGDPHFDCPGGQRRELEDVEIVEITEADHDNGYPVYIRPPGRYAIIPLSGDTDG